MSRLLNVPYASSARKLSIVAPIAKGGTGSADVLGAASALGAVSRTSLGQANGVAQTQGSGQFTVANLPASAVTTPMVDGPDTISINSITALTIKNYDVNTTYTLAASVGSVSRSADVITYTAPSTPQNGTITINGRVLNITISPIQPLAPSITSPVAGAVNQSFASLAFTASAFALPSGTPNHLSSDWQVATDPGFVNVTVSSFNDTVNKTSWNVSNINLSTPYWVRVRYKDSVYGYGDWSKGSAFTTRATVMAGLEEAKLLASDPAQSDQLGWSVSLTSDGSRVVVGAANKTGSAGSTQGAVYVYLRTGTSWAQEAKLLASDPATNAGFGCSVSMTADGSRLAIGAFYKAGTYTQQGAVYIFLRTGTSWAQEQKLLASDPTATNEFFGCSVSISSDGTRLTVGAYGKTVTASTQGAVYVFLRTGTTWAQEQKLVASDATATDNFGWSVSMSIDGTRLITGAPSKPGAGALYFQGACYVFLRTGTSWAQEAKLVQSDPGSADRIGYSVSMTPDGTRVVAGAYLKTGPSASSNQGAVYVYLRTGTSWVQEAKLVSGDPMQNERFGISVSISTDGAHMVVGAFNKADSFTSQGAAYTFTRTGVTWAQENKLLASDAAASDNFGASVAISGDNTRLAISAYYKTGTAGTLQGALYIEA